MRRLDPRAPRASLGTAALLLLLLPAAPAGEPKPDLDGETAPPAVEAPPAPADAPAEEDFSEATQQFRFATGLFVRGLFREAAEEYRRFLEEHPEDARRGTARFNLAKSLFKQNQYAAAEKAFQNFLKATPEDHPDAASARLHIGLARFERDAYEGAVAVLQPLVEPAAPATVRRVAHYYLGRSLQELGRLEEAAAVLADPPPETPADLLALGTFARGEVEAARNRPAAAEKHFRRFLQNHAEHRLANAARLRLADALRQQEQYPAAAKIYAAVAEGAAPPQESRQAWLGLGWSQFRLGDFTAASQAARQGLSARAPVLEDELRHLLGSALLKREEYDQAEDALKPVDKGKLADDALLQRVWAALGAARLDAAAELAQAYLKRFPEGQAGTAHYLLGTARFRQADYEHAAGAFAAARKTETTPYRAEAAFQYALALERLGRHVETVGAYGFFIANFPRHEALPSALLGQGNAWVELEKWQEAVGAFQRLRELERATPAQREQALLQQAVCHYELNKYDRMDQAYRTLLKEYPRSTAAPEALYWVAWGAQRRKQYKEAIGLYRRFLEKHADHKLAPRARYRLGMTHYQAGDEPAAAELFYNIVTEHPGIQIGQTEFLWLGSYFLQHDDPQRAESVFTILRKRHPGPEMRATALYWGAEAQRRIAQKSGREKDWRKAAEGFRALLREKGARFQALGHFGLGQSLRHLGELKEARSHLEQVELPPADPMRARLQFELAEVARAQDRPEEALRRFMQVGVLYDDRELTGRSLLAAAEISRAQGDEKKAVTLLQDLAGPAPGSYGAKYAESRWAEEARRRLAEMEEAAAPPPPPAERPDVEDEVF
jgi:TolA-binding protein